MPRRTDLQKILVIGSGPIVIGQACEFDYSGVQGIKALREDGYSVILINSNPATIMTDPHLADRTYIEPLTPEFLELVLARERPQGLLSTLGGQTALNLATSLAERGVLEKYGVELLGAKLEAIQKAEDRQLFKQTMQAVGLNLPKSRMLTDAREVKEAARELGFPVIVRASFTLGGTGGGIAYNLEDLRAKVGAALEASPVKRVLLEESVIGWKEYELEVMRDAKDNFVVICSIENLDPMGVHTGDSITVAPAMTLTDRQYQEMRDEARRAISAIGVETGGCNVQFGVEPKTGRRVIIEVNPRVSRSSALASKATGFPIAKIATKLAVGYTLDEIPNDITRKTPASFEPSIDYVVTKVPRFAFEKFSSGGEEYTLDTAMKSVGEVMAIGRTFKESLQKALRGLEVGKAGLETGVPKRSLTPAEEEALLRKLAMPCADRIFALKAALEAGLFPQEIAQISSIDPWFIHEIQELVAFEGRLRAEPMTPELLLEAKRLGFSDAQLGRLSKKPEAAVRRQRWKWGIRPVFKSVDTCAAEFEASTPYFYSTYETGGDDPRPLDKRKPAKKRVVIIGSGPNRIGQGIEFDYCCVHAVQSLREAGFEAVMLNCNPETVSTDYDTSDRLYFEPLTLEDTLEVLHREKPYGVIVQFGGQTPLNLTLDLAKAGAPILGTSPSSIDMAESRERFGALLKRLRIPVPAYGIARSVGDAVKLARRIGYPLMVRPSYVLGGRAMEAVYDEDSLKEYVGRAVKVSSHPAILVDRFLSDATEVDVDAVCDGKDVFIGGIMEHIEEAGIHSGDSACTLPTHSLTPDQLARISDYTRRMALGLKTVGLINIQYAIKDNVVYVLEANPRASRTTPFVSKATALPLAKIAARVMTGTPLKRLIPKELRSTMTPSLPYTATKEVVLPFLKFRGVDPMLGPEMKSTGEVMGIDSDFPRSFIKSQAASGMALPTSGAVFISVRDEDKPDILPVAAALRQLGFTIHATKNTHHFFERHGIETRRVFKLGEGKPDVLDLLKQRNLSLVINTPSGKRSRSDGYAIRRTALELNIPAITNINSCQAAIHGIAVLREAPMSVRSLQEHHERLAYKPSAN